MSYNITEGTTVRFYTTEPFTSISGTAINPDTVYFSYQIQGQTSVTHTWTNPSGDTSGVIVNTGTGLFQADISTTGLAGVWNYVWGCYPSSGLDTTKTAVVAEGTVTVSQTAIQ